MEKIDKNKDIKCMDCVYCTDYSKPYQKQNYFVCKHKDINKSAERYEKITGKRLVKANNFIGFKPIKTTLKYCPLKEVKDDD